MEITITGANALTYPVLNIWDWVLAVYLFVISAAAGLLVMAALCILKERVANPERGKDVLIAAALVPSLLLVGMLTLFSELGIKQNAHWLFLSLSFSSPMFWGGWGLVLTFFFSALLALSLVADAWEKGNKFYPLEMLSIGVARRRRPLAYTCCGLGAFTGTYAGISLSGLSARPLWDSAVAPLLFLISSMVTGAALFLLISRRKTIQLFFTKFLVFLTGAEIITIIIFFLDHIASSPAKRDAALLLLDKNHLLLTVFSLLFGVCAPFALVAGLIRIDPNGKIPDLPLLRIKICAYLSLSCGLIMRLGWIYAGQLAKLS